MRHVCLSNREVVHNANSSLGQRYFVSLVELYVSQLPFKAKDKNRFYCKPISSFVSNQPWYCNIPVGGYLLTWKLKEMFISAGLDSDGIS